jgi:hypothetical protein
MSRSEAAAEAEKQRILKRLEQGKAQSLEDLLVVAQLRGYKPSWAHIVFNQRMAKRAAKMSGCVAGHADGRREQMRMAV